MAESNNKEWIYVLVGVGITLLAVVTVLTWLTNRKVERMSWEAENQQPSTLQGLGNMSTVSSVTPVLSQTQTQPVIYDERIYRMLEDRDNKIHDHLEDVNSNINGLKSLNYRIPSLNTQPRAGGATSIRTGAEDKTRQRDFGMN